LFLIYRFFFFSSRHSHFNQSDVLDDSHPIIDLLAIEKEREREKKIEKEKEKEKGVCN